MSTKRKRNRAVWKRFRLSRACGVALLVAVVALMIVGERNAGVLRMAAAEALLVRNPGSRLAVRLLDSVIWDESLPLRVRTAALSHTVDVLLRHKAYEELAALLRSQLSYEMPRELRQRLLRMYGDVLCEIGEWQKAAAVLGQVDQDELKDAAYYGRLAGALKHIGRLEEALEVLGQGISRYDTNVTLLIERAFIHLRQRKYYEAIEDLKRASVDRNPDGTFALVLLAAIYAFSEEPDIADGQKSLEYLHAARNRGAVENAFFYDVLAGAKARQGRFDEALEIMQRAVEAAHADGKVGWIPYLLERMESYSNREAWTVGPAVCSFQRLTEDDGL